MKFVTSSCPWSMVLRASKCCFLIGFLIFFFFLMNWPRLVTDYLRVCRFPAWGPQHRCFRFLGASGKSFSEMSKQNKNCSFLCSFYFYIFVWVESSKWYRCLFFLSRGERTLVFIYSQSVNTACKFQVVFPPEALPPWDALESWPEIRG